MAKRIKFLDLNAGGAHLEGVYFPEDKGNPFRIFLVWRDVSFHRVQIVKYGDFMSCLFFLKDFYANGLNKYSNVQDVKKWIEERTI